MTWDKNGKHARGVDYSRLTVLLIEATKEQQIMISNQQHQIKRQQTELKHLSAQVRTMQASLRTTGRTSPEVHTAKMQYQ
ncbi:MAG TPA: hypothetical protein VMF10_04385 [Candidatus Aquilonibacter sp.]|nr:hypothetical protein [Candidatus Aquilonibacter sp.]